MTDKFENIDRELVWEMFKMSDGNPYIIQDLVREHNRDRERDSIRERKF